MCITMRVTHNLTRENKPFSVYTSFLVIVINGLLRSRKELSITKGKEKKLQM